MKRILTLLVLGLMCSVSSFAQRSERNHAERFEQLGTMLRSPNVYRTASGAPGHMYWQQKADYKMNIELDDKNKKFIIFNNNLTSFC